jgi:hypothetical protein
MGGLRALVEVLYDFISHLCAVLFLYVYLCMSVYACFKFTHLHYIISKQCINKQTHTYIYGDQRLADIASMDERNDRELLLQSELLKCLKVVNSSIKYILLLDNMCVCVCFFFFALSDAFPSLSPSFSLWRAALELIYSQCIIMIKQKGCHQP